MSTRLVLLFAFLSSLSARLRTGIYRKDKNDALKIVAGEVASRENIKVWNREVERKVINTTYFGNDIVSFSVKIAMKADETKVRSFKVISSDTIQDMQTDTLWIIVKKFELAQGLKDHTSSQPLSSSRSFESTNQTIAYILPGLFSGLTNQLLGFYAAALLAQKRSWTLVLPHWRVEYNDFENGLSLPFNYFYSLKETSFKWDYALPPTYLPACLAQLQCSSFEMCRFPSENTMKIWAAKHKVICLNADASYRLQDLFKEKAWFESWLFMTEVIAIRKSLVVSSLFLEASEHIRKNLGQYFTIHLRTEGDFKYACSVWSPRGWNGSSPLRCFEGEDAVMIALQKFNLSSTTRLLIMNGESAKPEKLYPRLCHSITSGISRCFRKEQILGFNRGIIKSTTSIAMIDFVLALSGSGFLGNMYSTMSQEIVAHFCMRDENSKMNCRDFFYNLPLN